VTTNAPASPRVFAVIAGGGTAGHLIPALAIAEQLADRGRSPRSIAFVASRRPVDARYLEHTEHPRLLLEVDGLQRSLAPRAVWRSLLAVPKLLVATALAKRQLRLWRPRVVVSVGGFASEPAVRAARALRVPVVVVSYDRRPGLATRRQARHAAAVAVAFADSVLPGARHAGAPVRARVRSVSRATAAGDGARDAAARVFGVDPRRLVVVAMGGSLGSRTINDAIERWVAANAGRDDVAVVHLAGDRYAAATGDASRADGSRPGALQYVRRASHAEMADVWTLADAVVCRAGASTVAELVTVGVPSIVVPWADAADDHQRRNARWLADAAAAIVVDEHETTARFDAELSRLLGDPVLREQLAARSFALGALNRSAAIGAVIEAAAS
jgi:UDP-N-acetylglucosamine:LPS N-acetylglucosamine transferase